MPKASPIQPTFSGGEFSPKVYGRVDNERYKTGLAKAENWLPTVQGPMVRRPGMAYSGADAKDPSKPPVLIPFQVSQTESYMLEFGDQYMRVFYGGAPLTTSSTLFRITATWSDQVGPVGATSSSRLFAMRSSFYPLRGEFHSATSVIAASSVLEIQSPYRHPDVHAIKFTQKDDAMFIVCSSYPEFVLERRGHLNWELKRTEKLDGPYLPLNSYRSSGDCARFCIVASSIPLSTSADGANVRTHSMTTGPVVAVANITYPNGSSGPVRVTTSGSHPYVTGDKVLMKGINGAANYNVSTAGVPYFQIVVQTNTTFDLQGTTFGSSYVNGGSVYPALFELNRGSATAFSDLRRNIALYRTDGGRAWGYITNLSDMATGIIAMPASSPNIQNGPLDQNLYWQLGVESVNLGYASAVTFHQNRRGIAGYPSFPQRVDLSYVGDYSNYAASGSSVIITDANAISQTLLSAQQNRLHWIASDTKGLLAGSFSTEWQVTPNSQAAALTPTNFNANPTSFFGSQDSEAVQTGNATLYIQKGGQRVRELNYFFQVDTYRSTDIAELSEHLMLPGLQKIVNQKETIPIVWALTTDGKLRSMTYSRDDATLKVGWAPHTLGGQSDSSGTAPVIKSIATLPSLDGTFDQLWCVVQRFVNGTSVCSIEYMNKIFDDKTLQEDSKHLDMMATYDSPVAISMVTAGSALVTTSAAHGISAGDYLKVTEVVGLNSSITSVDGVVTNSNLVNYRTFIAGTSSGSTLFLLNPDTLQVEDTRPYSAYFSGGEIRKMVQTITGLTWLKNETVSVVADGKSHPNVIVNSGGAITLDYKAAVVQIGYDYNSDGKTLRLEAGSADGSSIGKLRRAHRAAFMVHRAGNLQVGPSHDRLLSATLESFDPPQVDRAPALYSGIVRESLETEHDFEGQVAFRVNKGQPAMIQSITTTLEEND